MSPTQQDTLTRAQRVRLRRQQTQAKPKRTPRSRKKVVTPPVETPPVVVSRYGVVSGAAVQSATSVRRQVRVARQKNTEVVASVPWLSLGQRWVSLGVSAFVFALLLALWYAPLFRVDVPEVQGVHYLEAGRVADALPVRNRPIFALSPQELADTLLRFPAVAHADVRLAFPNRVIVTVTERAPVLVWQTTRRNWWVDSEGVAFVPVTEEMPENALVVKASDLPPDAAEVRPGVMQVLTPAQITSLRALSNYVPAGTPLVFNPRYGIGWQAKEGWQVYVGQSLEEMDKRMALYQAIARWLTAQNVHPALVNIASLRAPYYRMEP